MTHFQIEEKERQQSSLSWKALAMKLLEEKNDPFEFIRYEWRELLITDPEEQAEFAKYCERKDNLDLRLDDFQVDAIRSVFDGKHTQVYISGGTKLGKGFVCGGLITNIWFDLFPDCKIVLVGPNSDHLKLNLFGEASKWRRKMTSYLSGLVKPDVQKENIQEVGKETHMIKLANTGSGEGMSGNHSSDLRTGAPVTMFLLDEASGTPDEFYNDALSQCRMLVAISNPRAPSGWFYRAYEAAKDFESGCITVNASTGPRRLISVGGIHCINVKASRLSNRIGPPKGMHIRGKRFEQGEPIPDDCYKDIRPLIPGQMTLDFFQLLEETKDKEWRAYGRFPKTGTAFEVFSGHWKKKHEVLFKERGELIHYRAIGLDVGASKSGDPSCLAFGDTHGLKELCLEQIKNQMELQGWIVETARQRGLDIYDGTVPISVDAQGIGKGIADSLEEDGAWVIKVENGAAAERDKLQYLNRRAEVYGELADAVDPAMSEQPWIIPVDSWTEPLWEEFFAHEKIFTSKPGQFRLNDKRRPASQKGKPLPDNRTPVEEKIGRSPDRCDATTLLYQAVRELPDFGTNTMQQFDPAAEIKETYVDRQTKMVQVLFWSGKKETLRQEEFEARFGKNARIFGVSDWATEVAASVS